MKRKVVLYGAFDRYNYGDNLMPILLEMYLQKNHPDKVSDIEFVYSSIGKSDLSKYMCVPTIAMRDLLDLPEDSTVIVVGGEVLGADVGVLYTHVQDSILYTKLLRSLRKISPYILSRFAKLMYDAVWRFPYIPDKKSFKNNVKVIFNTVGGIPPRSQQYNLSECDYISARDDRTFSAIQKCCKPVLVPDSVLLVSSVVDDAFLKSRTRKDLIETLKSKYITVQACPYKVDFTEEQLADELNKVIERDKVKVILLPIGYASGHDDSVFLRKVDQHTSSDVIFLDDLNVWEIMYVIKCSLAFYGTSLHGVITAMSFLVPHYSLNYKIEKLTSFLKTWSVEPYTTPINYNSISDSLSNMEVDHNEKLRKSVEHAQDIIKESVRDISKII